ncbi:MAG: ATP-binding cassette domain-containing protein, partial [Deinococcus sp.]|nr:ATP-binding cassette domain-containing protein [Deinococcus sp.]
MLAVERLSRQFGGLMAVDSVSFSVQPGQIFGLIGPNGAGKTT